MTNKIKIGVIASGSGSNLQAIIDRCADGYIPGEIKVVLSDKEQAFALERARKADIPAIYLNPKDYADRAAYDAALVATLKEYGVEVVALAGYMRLVTSTLLAAFPQRVLNIHPALLPSFPGLHGQKQAFDYGVKISGCTVHFVDEGMDTGPIIAQSAVPVLSDDTADTLAARILEQEHQVYPEVLKLLAEGKIVYNNGRVTVN